MSSKPFVLVLPWIDLIFFIVASVGLWSGFVLEAVDNTKMLSLLLSNAYTKSRPFLFLTSPYQWGGWGAQEARGTQLGQLIPTDQGISQTTWHHAQHINQGEEEGRGECLEWWHSPSQVTITCDGVLLRWGWLNCLTMGSAEGIPCSALLVQGFCFTC